MMRSSGQPVSRREVIALLAGAACLPLTEFAAARCPGSAADAVDLPLHYRSATEIGRLLAARELSSVELVQHMLDRIATLNRRLNAYSTVLHEQALDAARRADSERAGGTLRGPLHGIPIAVKDLCDMRGVATLGGSPLRRAHVAAGDSTVVRRLRDAGAVLLGKLNLTEGALAGYHPDMPIPVNPWDASRWAGVSSSGSGVAVAAGLCFAAIGTDTGGSIRYPSSANGVVGLKPSHGRVSLAGVLPLAPTLDHVGPMARRVADAAMVMDAIGGHDPADPHSVALPGPATLSSLADGVEGLVVGIDREHALGGVDHGEASTIEDALRHLSELGVRIVDVRMPDLDGAIDAWMRIVGVEALAAHAEYYPARSAQHGPFLREFLDAATRITDAQRADAYRRRERLRHDLDALLSTVDAVVCPGGDVPAARMPRELLVGPASALNGFWAARAEASSPPLKDTDLFTMPANLAGLPAICLPSGFSTDGMPYSVQFIGRRAGEATLCRIAHGYEQRNAWHLRHPDV
jgi:amidase